ncbi:MAG: ArdC-like ssDNA-binding domain-containing protein [Acidobacteriaceae bacterium]
MENGHSETLAEYLTAMARFRNYSFGHILLIAQQRAQSTHVAGIYAWNQLKRRVKRGERGIQILAPMLGKKRKDDDDPEGVEGGAVATAEDRKPQAKYLVGFRPVYVVKNVSTS